MITKLFPGQRLSYSGALCTVRYHGPVKDTKGEWLGVEWDDASRGKHCGEHVGVKYFECLSKQPTAGSFIRSTRPSDESIGFLEALRQKYAPDSEDLNSDSSPSSGPIEISGKVVEEVGFEKIRRQLATLQELRIILLDGLCIVGLGSRPWSEDYEDWLLQVQKIKEVCPRVIELDLSRNLLENWLDVAGICNALQLLKSLKLNCNRFRDLSLRGPEKTELHSAFGSIKELHLDDNLFAWDEIFSLTTLFTSLTSLSLSANNLVLIPSPLQISTLTQITLNNNLFTSLSSISLLSLLPKLQTLSLASNQISYIHTSNNSPPNFSSVLTLDLSSNAIQSLDFIAHLPTSFPSLASFRTSDNPFSFTLSPDEAFIHTVARIGTLTTLNYSTVTPADRINAELYYLSSIGKQLSSTTETEEPTILKIHHPRYTDLCMLHGGGPLIVRQSTNTSSTEYCPNSLNSRLINFTFYLLVAEQEKAHLLPASTKLPLAALAKQPTTSLPVSSPPMATDPSEQEKEILTTIIHQSLIPRSFTTYRLKSFAGALFNLPPMHLRLIWETGEWDPVGRASRQSKNNDCDEEYDDRWSVDSSSSSSESEDEGMSQIENAGEHNSEEQGQDGARPRTASSTLGPTNQVLNKKKEKNKGRFIPREVELVDGTRQVGFWIEEKEAKVRVEVREKMW